MTITGYAGDCELEGEGLKQWSVCRVCRNSYSVGSSNFVTCLTNSCSSRATGQEVCLAYVPQV